MSKKTVTVVRPVVWGLFNKDTLAIESVTYPSRSKARTARYTVGPGLIHKVVKLTGDTLFL